MPSPALCIFASPSLPPSLTTWHIFLPSVKFRHANAGWTKYEHELRRKSHIVKTLHFTMALLARGATTVKYIQWLPHTQFQICPWCNTTIQNIGIAFEIHPVILVSPRSCPRVELSSRGWQEKILYVQSQAVLKGEVRAATEMFSHPST